MNCCLWLNRVKVRSAEDIKNNFDPASLRGYLLGGSLIRWLSANGGTEAAKKLQETEYSADINARLEYAFGLCDEFQPVEIITKKSVISNERENHPPAPNSFSSGLSGSSGASGSFSGSAGLGYGLHII